MTDNICELDLSPVVVKVLAEAGIVQISVLENIDEPDLLKLAKPGKEIILKKAAEMALRRYNKIAKTKNKENKAQQEYRKLTDMISEGQLLKPLKLTYHSETCLIKAGIATIAQLKAMGENDLKKIHTLGKKDRKEIVQKQKNYEATLARRADAKTGFEEQNQHRKIRLARRAARRCLKRMLWENHDVNVIDICSGCEMFGFKGCAMYAKPFEHCPKLKYLPKNKKKWPQNKPNKNKKGIGIYEPIRISADYDDYDSDFGVEDD